MPAFRLHRFHDQHDGVWPDRSDQPPKQRHRPPWANAAMNWLAARLKAAPPASARDTNE